MSEEFQASLAKFYGIDDAEVSGENRTPLEYGNILQGRTALKQDWTQCRLNVVGTTNYLHKMAYFDRNVCVPLENPIFTVMARYSSLLAIHNSLVVEVKAAPLPEFPPKRWVRNISESSIRERCA
jgi:hypothetical protein